jgi:hypothetical protein
VALTFGAPSLERIAAVDRTLAGLREIAVDRAVRRGVLSAMRELADGGSHGAHPCLWLTSLSAQTSGLDVLHYDHHFKRLGDLLGVHTVWIVDPSA